MTLQNFIAEAVSKLSMAGAECGDVHSHIKKIWEVANHRPLMFTEECDVEPEMFQKAQSILERRLNGEPLQYIEGRAAFWNSEFEVGAGVLIPRPETELLVEKLLDFKEGKVAELGAGSGNIGISVLLENAAFKWHAFESCPRAFVYLERNRKRLIPQYDQYIAHPLEYFVNAAQFAKYDYIVSNPPYVTSDEIERLSREVQSEPKEALYGGVDGMEIIRQLVDSAASMLNPGGRLLFEFGFGQAEKVRGLLEAKHFGEITISSDYSQIPRIAVATWMHLS